MRKQIIALLLVLLLIPVWAFCEAAPERMTIRLVINGQAVNASGAPASAEETVGGYIINGVLYLPAGVIPSGLGAQVSFDEDTNTLYIDTEAEAEEEAPQGHCWKLVDTAHDVFKNEQDGPRTWKYEYKDITGGGQYVIDFTWNYHDEYSHYTAVGECTNPPKYVLPEQRFTVSLKVYNENVVGDRGWGILGMGYIQYDSKHYASTTGFFNVIEDDPKNYNASDGDRSWQLWAEFPEGQIGETISFTCQFHRGDCSPVSTTWTYEWVD